MNLWKRTNNAPIRRAVAYYRHSAQDRQENSVEIQQEQVRKFATDNGIEIIREFADKGKSGLSVEGRDEFNEMLHAYVEAGKEEFDFVLVLDVSRWGRFQETDLSAYYTGLCIQHGKQVVFTTIGFPKDNDLLHGLHLSIERYRAASYSRELSGKVWKGCAKIASGGYWAGGCAPYGMCRLLLDEQRHPVQALNRGEHKAIHNQRVTLAPGDATEVETIRSIFRSFVHENKTPDMIAVSLNKIGQPAPGGGRWRHGAIVGILGNEMYAGVMIWNKTSQKMKSRSRPNPTVDWIRAEGAFEPIVPGELFQAAQAILSAQAEAIARRFSEADMIIRLREIHEHYGTITSRLVAAAKEMVSPTTYAHRFHSFDLAYQAMFREVIEERRAQIIQTLRDAAVELETFDNFVVIDNYFSIAIQPAMPIAAGYEASWTFHPDQRAQVDLTIGVPLSCPQNCEVLGYLAFPRLMFKQKVKIHSAAGAAAELYAYPLLALIKEMRK